MNINMKYATATLCMVNGTFSEGLRMTQFPATKDMGSVHIGTFLEKKKEKKMI